MFCHCPTLTTRPLRALVALLGATLVLLPGAARASLITVDTKVDEFSAVTSGDAGCSLREAVHAANTNTLYGSCASGQPGEDIILLPFEIDGDNGPYDLTLTAEGDLQVTDELQIWGTGGAQPQIHAQGIDRIFDVAASTEKFTLLRLLLRGGDAGSEAGGAITTHASVAHTFEDVWFWDNRATTGGAIHVVSSFDPPETVFDMTDVTFQDNEASIAGGALYFGQSPTTVTLATCTGCSFDGNVAPAGAAISLRGAARVRLVESTLTGNESGNAGGGPAGTIDGSTLSWTTLEHSWLGFNSNDGERGAGYNGGGVVILDDTTFKNGIYLVGGTLEATDTTFENTERTALHTVNQSVVTLTRVRVVGSPWSGAETTAAVRVDGPVEISDSVFEDNAGAIDCHSCQLAISSTSFVDNVNEGDQGGAIHASGATVEVELENSTFSRNSAKFGGALYLTGGAHFELRNVTIADNTAEKGGGIFGVSLNALPLVSNTIIAGNSATVTGSDCDSSLLSEGWNLIGIADDCTVTPTAGDHFGTAVSPIDAGLQPLATVASKPVHGLTVESPALDSGNPNPTGTTGSSCRPRDQVGQDRPVDAGGGPVCDIGAIEETSPVSILFADGFESGDLSGWALP